MRCMVDKNNTSDVNDCLDGRVVVGIKREVIDLKPYLDFLKEYGTNLESHPLESDNRYRQEHYITLDSSRTEFERLLDYYSNNKGDPIVGNILYIYPSESITDAFD